MSTIDIVGMVFIGYVFGVFIVAIVFGIVDLFLNRKSK